MSLDSINPAGGKIPRLNQTNQVAPQRAVQAAPQTETSNQVAKQGDGGFQASSELKSESAGDQKAGEAKASEILGAWSSGAPNVATAGPMNIEGASNTAVNQVHGVNNGVYAASNGAKPGFTGATVYS